VSDQGPTTVGSIVGKLRMDRERWLADLAATKSEIRQLEAMDPDIHIDTNAASAIAQLQATAAAADVLGAKEEDLGRKTRRATEETVQANEANRTSVSRIGAITTAVALLVPLLTPVAAAAVGLGGAFLGMGAAGVLALFGIHSEMEKGTSTGRAYQAGLDTLHASLSTLSRTAAVAMLSSFRRSVADVAGAMPFLNTQVGQFSSLLGESGANAVSGVINALRVLNPLFVTAAVYLRSLTAGFQEWTQGSGIEQFGGYALATLPQVVDVLGKLSSMVMHILEALAPLGTIGIAVLSGIADMITAIPVDVLSQLIVTITWGAVAFKAWGFVAPMLATIATQMGAVSAATTIATGPIGWVVAGLAALAGILAVIVASNTGATRAMQDYTAAVQADSGAIGENIRQKVAMKLLDSGAYDAAKKLGISLEVVTDATLGNKDALAALAPYMKAANGDQGALADISKETGVQAIVAAKSILTLADGVKTNGAAIAGEIDRYKTLQDAVKVTTSVTKEQQWADEAAAAAVGVSVEAIQEARKSQDGMKDATAKATAEMYLQNDAAGLLQQSLDLLNGKTLSAEDAQNQFESQLVRLTDTLNTNGTSLDGMTEGAIANRGALIDLVKSAQDSAVAYRDQGHSSDEARQKMIDAKQAIVDQMVANGANRDSVQAYIDKLFQIPDYIPPTKIEADTSAATAAVQGFQTWVSQRVATIQVRATLPDLNGEVSGSGRPGVANGGTIPGLAAGGSGTVVGPGDSHSDTAGVYRLANREEIISNRFGQADRNRALLKAINAGYTPSAGSVAAAPSPVAASSRGDVTVMVNVDVTTVQNEDPRVLGNIIGRGVKDALVGVQL
jgi:hypothetical protein